MTEDDVLREVRAAREAYAQSHNFDVRAMVADLRARDAAGDWPVVRRTPGAPSRLRRRTRRCSRPGPHDGFPKSTVSPAAPAGEPVVRGQKNE